VSGLSDDGAGNGEITTTDLLGTDGENPVASPNGDYTDSFGGTSAATPQVSGIVALMLEANPNLGWRDVQDILAYTARHTGSAVGGPPSGDELHTWDFNGAADWNLGGLHHSNDYGFGLVDARAAVRLAESWTLQSTSANDFDGGTFTTGQIVTVPDGGQTQLQFSYGGSVRTETAEITLTIAPADDGDPQTLLDHQPGDLSLVLVSPSGTESTIFNRPGYHASGDPDGAETFFGGSETLTFTFRSEAFRGEGSQGTWTLRAEDHNVNGLRAVLTDFAFTVHGGLPQTDDVYVFTDEFGAMAALPGEGGRATLTDGGGIDTLNAAAVSGAVGIDLTAGQTSTLAGGSFTIDGATLIENAIGGDGDDAIAGNFQANALFGMRGDDTLLGGDGDDTLSGGPGADSLDGGTGIDVTTYAGSLQPVAVDLQSGNGSGGDAEGDTLDDIENLTGSASGDTLVGSDVVNTLIGGSGDDHVFGDPIAFLADFETGVLGPAQPIGPVTVIGGGNPDVGGSFMARLAGGGPANPLDTDIEASLGIDAGTLDLIGGDATRGMAIHTDLDVIAGNEISFDWFFNSAEQGTNFFDFAFFSYSYAGTGTNGAIKLIDTSHVPAFGDTSSLTGDGDGWLTSVFTAPETGSVTVGIGVMNFSDTVAPPFLDVDNVALHRDAAALVPVGTLPQSSELITGELELGLVFPVGTDDVLLGGDGDDTLLGTSGADSLDGGKGADSLGGGNGDDTLTGGDGNDTLDGGTGEDTADYRNNAEAVSVALAGGSAISGSSDTDVVIDIEHVVGSAHDDAISGEDIDANNLAGGGGDDTLDGLSGDDLLDGGEGDDTLIGGAGGDSLVGGTGSDWVAYSGSQAGVDVDLGTNQALGGDAAGDTFGGIEHLSGSGFSDTLTGNAGANTLMGRDGGDTLFGLDGEDLLEGGIGSDTLNGGSGNDILSGGPRTDAFNVLVGAGGNDEAIFHGPMADFAVWVRGPAGGADIDHLLEGTNVSMGLETLRFDDGVLNLVPAHTKLH